MQWFPGNVATAIQVSRKNRALLIVFISTNDTKGEVMQGFWDEIEPSMINCPVVGIRMVAGEEAAKQFSEIYPTPVLPASYLIDQNGKPLEIITNLVTIDRYRVLLDRATATFVANTPMVAAAPTPVVTAPPNPELAAENERKRQEAQKLLDQQKVVIAQKKADDLRMKKEKEQLETARKAHEERQEKAIIEAAKQRAKEKLETEKERERIKAQIRADREDAKKRHQPAAATPVEAKNVENLFKSVPSDRCRLQVRLPNGSTFVEEFPSSDNLLSLIEIVQKKHNVTGAFEISQMYPRRVFSTEELARSYLENGLTPSASLIVIQKPSPQAAIVAKTNGLIGLLSWILLSPFNFIFGIFGSFFGGGGAKKEDAPAQGGGSGDGPRQRGMPRSAEVRRRGNVAGLENPNDDDPEERASWNGNSTQFM